MLGSLSLPWKRGGQLFFIADLVFACSCLEEELRFGRADVNFLLSQIFVCRLKKEVGSTMSIFCGL